MNILEQISGYLHSLPEHKRQEMQILHDHISELLPGTRIWYDDGKDEKGKIVSNPTIGYGEYTIQYANGSEKPFFQIGLSANSTGISIYILGLKDKAYLSKTFGPSIGKASVTGYCIKFKSLKDIFLPVLDEAIVYGVQSTS